MLADLEKAVVDPHPDDLGLGVDDGQGPGLGLLSDPEAGF